MCPPEKNMKNKIEQFITLRFQFYGQRIYTNFEGLKYDSSELLNRL